MKTYILFVALLFSCSSFGESYQVTFQKGKYEILRANKPVSPPIESGDLVKVSKGGILVIRNSKEVHKIMGDTVIKPFQDKEESVIGLVKGAIISQVTKQKFKIKTKNAAMGVRGTQFFVSANESDVWMCVQEGVVAVEKGKTVVEVPAGKGVFVDKKDVSKPAAFAWTKKINWKMDPKEGELDHKINLNYDVLENFYD